MKNPNRKKMFSHINRVGVATGPKDGKCAAERGQTTNAEPLERSDIELVASVKAGDRRSFSELVRRHQRTLLRVTMRFTREQSLAEDIVQESFLKAFQKIELFEGRSSFKSWICQIALNTAKNRFRDRSFDQLNIEDLQVGVDPGAETEMLKTDVKKKIRAEIDKLPSRQRVALSLRIFEDLSFKEIAQIMECPYDTAKANYRHALLRLRERLQAIEGMETLREDLVPLQAAGIMTEIEA